MTEVENSTTPTKTEEESVTSTPESTPVNNEVNIEANNEGLNLEKFPTPAKWQDVWAIPILFISIVGSIVIGSISISSMSGTIKNVQDTFNTMSLTTPNATVLELKKSFIETLGDSHYWQVC